MSVSIHGFRPNRALKPMLEKIKQCQENFESVILLVPEHYTLVAEKDILNTFENNGFFSLQILTPSYLSSLVLKKGVSNSLGFLEPSGEMVLLINIVERLPLKYYDKSEIKQGIFGDILHFLHDLQRNAVSLSAIQYYIDTLSNGSLKQKWEDIYLIYEQYLPFFDNNFINTVLENEVVANRIVKQNLYAHDNIFVYGFDQLIKPLRTLLVALAQVANEVLIYANVQSDLAPDFLLYEPMKKSLMQFEETLAQHGIITNTIYYDLPLNAHEAICHIDKVVYCENNESYNKVQDAIYVFNADTPYDEINFTVNSILDAANQGQSLETMAVLLPEGNDYAFILYSKLFNLNIPFYSYEDYSLIEHPLSRFIVHVLYYLSNKNSKEYLDALLGDGLHYLKIEEISYLKKYCKQNGIEPWAWQYPFKRNAEKVEMAETLRLKFLEPLLELEYAVKNAVNFSDMGNALLKFIDDNHFFEKLIEDESLFFKYSLHYLADYSNQMTGHIIDVLNQVNIAVDGCSVGFAQFAEYMENAFAETRINPLPPIKNALAISTVSRVLLSDIETVYILGFNENLLSSHIGGLFTDNEMSEFQHHINAQMYISDEDLTNKNKQHLKKALTLAQNKLYLCYSKTDFSGEVLWPFALLTEMENNYFKDRLNYLYAEDYLSKEALDDKLISQLNKWIERFSRQHDERKKQEIGQEIANILHYFNDHGELELIATKKETNNLKPKTAKKLFKTDTISISRLEQFASCPFKHFMDYGIKPDKNEAWEPKKTDEGSFYHYVLEMFFRTYKDSESLKSLTEDEILAKLEEIMATAPMMQMENPFNDNVVSQVQLDGIKRKMIHACKILIKQQIASKFSIRATEYRFSEKSKTPYHLTLADGTLVALRGSIDRLDIYMGKDDTFLRIIDYKSGTTKFDPSKLFAGVQLQLLIYLNVAIEQYKASKPSGVFYFHIDNPWIDDALMDIESAMNQKLKENKMQGFILKDVESVNALDSNPPVALRQMLNQDGSFSKNDMLLGEDEFRHLMQYCVEKAKCLVEEIHSGNVSPTPLELNDQLPCQYCLYDGICHDEKEIRVAEKMSMEEFLARVEAYILTEK